MTQKQNNDALHKLFVADKTKITITGVKNVMAFDESAITSELCDARTLTIEGSGLNIVVLDLEKSSIEAECTDIYGIYYSDGIAHKKSLFSRLVRS